MTVTNNKDNETMAITNTKVLFLFYAHTRGYAFYLLGPYKGFCSFSVALHLHILCSFDLGAIKDRLTASLCLVPRTMTPMRAGMTN